MGANRVFFAQRALDEWLDQGRITLSGDELSISGTGEQFRLEGALHFVADVADTGDPHGLTGKVKTLRDVQVMQGEHCADSVVLGDSAYEVVEGFLGEALPRRGDDVDTDLDPAHPLAQLLDRLHSDLGAADS